MSSTNEGKIPTLRKELIKAIADWDSKSQAENLNESPRKTEDPKPVKSHKLFNSIKEQLDKLSI